LGNDPFEPHNNILAGSAYIREMYERFGSPGFLAGYNAGPDRVDAYLAGTASLPDETVNYLAAITPNLGNAVPMSGPLAVYASARPNRGIIAGASVTSLAAGCDLNAAYDPNHPCTSLERAAVAAAAPSQAFLQPTGANGCDLNAAFDPNHPCTSLAQAAAVSAPAQPAFVRQAVAAACDPNAAYDPDRPCRSPEPAIRVAALPQPALAQPETAVGCDPNAAFDPRRPCRAGAAGRDAVPPGEPVGAEAPPFRDRLASRHLPVVPARDWAIQVGAFANPALARAVAEGARAQAPNELRAATLVLPPTPYRGSVLYRARLAHLSAKAAADACTHLNRRQLPCIVVQPNRS
jgi:D-alanyl-D-alanine carboxypeptidase